MSIKVKDADGATQTINTIPNNGQATSGFSQPVVIASDQSAIPVVSTAIGVPTDARAPWYDSVTGTIGLMKLWLAVTVGAGNHVYGYDATGNLSTDAWTLFGTTRTKTFTYTQGKLTGESDWV